MKNVGSGLLPSSSYPGHDCQSIIDVEYEQFQHQLHQGKPRIVPPASHQLISKMAGYGLLEDCPLRGVPGRPPAVAAAAAVPGGPWRPAAVAAAAVPGGPGRPAAVAAAVPGGPWTANAAAAVGRHLLFAAAAAEPRFLKWREREPPLQYQIHPVNILNTFFNRKTKKNKRKK